MRHIRNIATAAFCICLAVSFGASADDTNGPTLTEIRAQQLEFRKDLQAGGGIFKDMSRAERNELASQQAKLLAMIEGKELVGDLDDASQVEAFNLLESINASINQVGDQQMVCEHIRKTGSHRKIKECKTVAQRRQEREAAMRELSDALKRPCNGEYCGQ